MNLKINFLLISFILLPSTPLLSAESQKLNLLTAPWEKYTEKDGTGLYFELIDKTLGMENFNFKLMPWKRAQNEFKKNNGDILLGESTTNKNCRFPQWAIDADFFSFFYLKSRVSEIPIAQDLKSKYKMIWVRGYGLHESAPEISKFEEVDDMKQGIDMILKKRADILIDYDEDLKDYIKSRKLDPNEHVVVPSSISGDYIYVCFKKNPKGESLAEKFDQKMNQLYKSGELKKIYLKYEREKNYNKVILKK